MCRTIGFLAFLTMVLLTRQVWAAPISSSNLWAAPTFTVGPFGATSYNPRIEGDYIYASRNASAEVAPPHSYDSGLARFPYNSTTAEQTSPFSSPTAMDQRTDLPYLGVSPAYVLASGGNGNPSLTRYNYADYSIASNASTGSIALDSFDWVDSDTIIGSSYIGSSTRTNLYLFDIGDSGGNLTATAGPVYSADVTTRIRSVRVGNTYTGYAYYVDSGVGSGNSAGIYAMNTSNGSVTMLGTETHTGANYGYNGAWSAVEAGGYLYVMSTADGINVYNLPTATSTLGAPVDTYSMASLQSLFPVYAASYPDFFGLDVSPDGSRMVISGYGGWVGQILATPLAGDANIDSAVNVADLTKLLNNYNQPGKNWFDGDFDANGTVNVADLTALLNNYNKTGGAVANASLGTSVPEPSSIGMLATLSALLGAWVTRRRSR